MIEEYTMNDKSAHEIALQHLIERVDQKIDKDTSHDQIKVYAEAAIQKYMDDRSTMFAKAVQAEPDRVIELCEEIPDFKGNPAYQKQFKIDLIAHLKKAKATFRPASSPALEKANEAARHLIYSHILVKGISKKGSVFWAPRTGINTALNPKAIEDALGVSEWKAYQQSNSLIAQLQYNPYWMEQRSKTEDGLTTINSYEAPDWLKPYYLDKQVTVVASPPQIYLKFFEMLCDGEKTDVDFLLDFLYVTLTKKARTFLCLFGEKRVGKGIFSDIVKGIVGESNYYFGNITDLKSNFNSQMENKAVVALNEFDVTPEISGVLKSLVDDQRRIEQKQVDAYIGTNHANIILLNNPKEVKHLCEIDFDDDRFSVVTITSKRLAERDLGPEFESETDFATALLDPDNIAQLGNYLKFTHKCKHSNWNVRYKNEKYLEVLKELAKPEWVYKVDDYMRNTYEVELQKIKAVLDVDAGRKKFKDYAAKSEIWELKQPKPGLHLIRSKVCPEPKSQNKQTSLMTAVVEQIVNTPKKDNVKIAVAKKEFVYEGSL
jgi:hypothetical protein